MTKSPLWAANIPTVLAIQTKLHCAAALSLRPSCGRGIFFFLWVPCDAWVGPFPGLSRQQKPATRRHNARAGPEDGGPCALLTPLSGNRDNKSIDCPSPVGAKCKQIERDGEQNRLLNETDILNRGTAPNEMPLSSLPSSFQPSLRCVPLSATWHDTKRDQLQVSKRQQVQRILQEFFRFSFLPATEHGSKWTTEMQRGVFRVAGSLLYQRALFLKTYADEPQQHLAHCITFCAQGHKHRTLHVRAACHKLN